MTNTTPPSGRAASRLAVPIAAACAALSLAPIVRADSGSVVSTYTGGSLDWSSSANWNGGIIPNGTDDVATLSNNYTSGGTISNISGTLGSLVYEDTSPSNNLLTFSGTTLNFATSSGTPTLSVSCSGFVAINLNLAITGTQGLTITNVGSTTTRFGTSSTWSGLTGVLTLDGGTFAPQAANKLPGSAGSSVRLTNGAVLNPGATSGRSQSIVGLDGDAGTSLKIAGSSGYTFGVNSTSGQSFNFAGNISGNSSTDSGTITVNSSVGATQKLSGNNTYAGTTTVNAGTLLINGTHIAAADGGAYTVNSGGILGGTGTIKPAFSTGGGVMIDVKSGGIVAPGDGGIGTLTLDQTASARTDLFAESGASFAFDVGAGVTSDTIAFVGSATTTEAIFNANTIDFTDLTAGSLASGSYLLFSGDADTDYAGLTLGGSYTGLNSIGGSLITAGLSVGAGLSGYTGVTLWTTGNSIYADISAVPEPASVALLAGCSILGAVAWRRRRAKSA